ncbi:Cfap69 [Scenedesmus sp. PABB004]|nr:Cfap69 [Scenedesmus sp. PABB004]
MAAPPPDPRGVAALLAAHARCAALHPRLAAALAQLCQANAGGFALGDLPAAAELLEALLCIAGGADGAASRAFREPACALLRALARPYVKRRAADELALRGALSRLLAAVLAALAPGVPAPLPQAAADVGAARRGRPRRAGAPRPTRAPRRAGPTPRRPPQLLADFSSAYNNRPGVQAVQQGAATGDLASAARVYHTHQSVLGESGAAQAMCAALRAALEQYGSGGGGSAVCTGGASGGDAGASLAGALLAALLNFSFSPELARQLLRAGLLPLLAQVLQRQLRAKGGHESKAAAQAVEALWNLLQLAPVDAQAALCTPGAGPGQDPGACEPEWEPAEPGAQPAPAEPPPWTPPAVAGGAEVWVPQSGGDSAASSRPPSRPQPELAGGCAGRACAAEASQGGTATAAELVEVLVTVFRRHLHNTSSKLAKEKRNDALAVLQLLTALPAGAAALARDGGALQLLVAAATTPELQPASALVPAGALTKEAGDHELKLLLWGALGGAAAAHPAAAAAVVPGLLRALLLVADESAGRGCFAVGRWSPEQLLTLRRAAWQALLQSAPACKQEFLSCGGMAAIVRHLDGCAGGTCSAAAAAAWAPRAGSPSGRAGALASLPGGGVAAAAVQGCFATGAGGSSASRSVELALRLATRLVAGDAALAAACADAGAVPVLLELLRLPMCADAAAAKAGTLLLLAELCAAGGRGCWTRLRDADGVGLLLHACAEPVVLSVLADLLSDARARPFFADWSCPGPLPPPAGAPCAPSCSPSLPGPGGASARPGAQPVTATQLLLAVWREQDAARGLSGADGLIANPRRPLAGARGAAAPGARPGAALCPAGHGGERRQLLERLGFAPAAGLPPADAAALELVRAYVPLRQGEVWQDIAAEFEATGLTPTEEDSARLTSGVERARVVAAEVRLAQERLLSAAAAEQRAAEHAGYAAMLAQAATDAKAKTWERDGAKLTMRERLAAKARKEDMLHRSLGDSLASAGASGGGGCDACFAIPAGAVAAEAGAGGGVDAGAP